MRDLHIFRYVTCVFCALVLLVHAPGFAQEHAKPGSQELVDELGSLQPGPPQLRLGILAYMGAEEAEVEWRGLQQYLQTALPQYRVEVSFSDLSGLRAGVAEGRLEFVLTNPGQYVELEAEHGLGRIATLEQGKLASSMIAVGAAVVAPRTRHDLRTLDDLRGQVLAVTDENAFGGYQTVWRELEALGMDASKDLAGLRLTGFPMQLVLDALVTGNADAGVIRACLLESLPDGEKRFKVLSGNYEPALGCTVSTRLYPNWPFASLRDTSPTMAREVAIALLRMDPETSGMSWRVPADYQVVHDVFRELQIGPYAYLQTTSLRDLIRKYWPFGMLALLGLFFWGLYTARSEYLVRIRTAALEQALLEREAFEQRMRANQEQADHLARLSVLGELSSTLAHELSQPLAGISNYAQSLLRRMDNGRLTESAVREASENIVQMSENAAGILKRIKGFARKRPGQRERRGLSALISDSVGLFQGMQSQAPQVEIVDTLGVDRKVYVDGLQLQQVMLNLLKNAQDAMRARPAEEQRIRLDLEEAEGWAWVHVRDRGQAMSDAALANLFEPFYTTKEDGLGLGLSICKGIIEAHGGQLLARRAASEPGDSDSESYSGMVFSLSLPLYEHDTRPTGLSD